MEEAFKMRNVLQEFLGHQGAHRPTILGMREHIFTGRLVLIFYLISKNPILHFSYKLKSNSNIKFCIFACYENKKNLNQYLFKDFCRL